MESETDSSKNAPKRPQIILIPVQPPLFFGSPAAFHSLTPTISNTVSQNFFRQRESGGMATLTCLTLFVTLFGLFGPPPRVFSDFSGFCQGALKGTNLRGQTETKRRFSQIYADFCRFSPFLRKQSIWETGIFAENHPFSQDFRRKPQEPAENR